MLNQAAKDREQLADILKISDEQTNFITNVQSGCGLIKYGASLVPFINKISKDMMMYDLNTTKPQDRYEQRKQIKSGQ